MQIVDGSAVIVLADSGQVMVFNETGTRILEAIDGTRSVEEVASIIESEYEVSGEEARQDLEAFLGTLAEADALTMESNSNASASE